nr:MAG TPA: hypothetical protein [Bacteriophage sp.]
MILLGFLFFVSDGEKNISTITCSFERELI